MENPTDEPTHGGPESQNEPKKKALVPISQLFYFAGK